jgi:hypothetical protein
MERHGLKDHEIAGLVSHVTNYIHSKLEAPESLRALVSSATTTWLELNSLRLDAKTNVTKAAEEGFNT